MIHEVFIEVCVVVEYPDGKKFCMAKFMEEKDARAWLEQQEPKEYKEWKLYKRHGRMEEARWEPLE